MREYEILMKLLEKLKKETSYCPYCDREYGHREDCILRGLWFDCLEEENGEKE